MGTHANPFLSPTTTPLQQVIVAARKLDGVVTASWWAVAAPTWALLLLLGVVGVMGAELSSWAKAADASPVDTELDVWRTVVEGEQWFPSLLLLRNLRGSDARGCCGRTRKCCTPRSASKAYVWCVFATAAIAAATLILKLEWESMTAGVEGLGWYPWSAALSPLWLLIILLSCCCCAVKPGDGYNRGERISLFFGVFCTVLLPTLIVLLVAASSADRGITTPARLMFIPFWMWGA